jgi:transcriptional regulator with XRE-family HTH domain
MDVAIAFGKVIRELRVKAGFTQEQLGFEADLRRTFISVLERGQQQPTLTTIMKLATALNTTATEVIARVEEARNEKTS